MRKFKRRRLRSSLCQHTRRRRALSWSRQRIWMRYYGGQPIYNMCDTDFVNFHLSSGTRRSALIACVGFPSLIEPKEEDHA